MYSFFSSKTTTDEILYEHAANVLQLAHQELANMENQLQDLQNELATLASLQNNLDTEFKQVEKKFYPLQRKREDAIIQRQLKRQVTPLTTDEYQQWNDLLEKKDGIKIQLHKLKILPEEIKNLREEIIKYQAKINRLQQACDEAIAAREQAKEFRHS
jgi:chromosome segregation ATPase